MSEKRRRVLYVDDEEALAFLVPLAMAPLGYEVIPFESARAALDEFRRRPGDFDAVVTDVSMPEMSGFDLARQILAVGSAVPVIITSGYVREGDRTDALSAGVSDVVEKPDTVEKLALALDRAIRAAGPR